MSRKYVVDASIAVRFSIAVRLLSSRIHIPLITADYEFLARIKNLPLVIPLREMEL